MLMEGQLGLAVRGPCARPRLLGAQSSNEHRLKMADVANYCGRRHTW
jgi:hypothetical protein